jgi:hypothetical protein
MFSCLKCVATKHLTWVVGICKVLLHDYSCFGLSRSAVFALSFHTFNVLPKFKRHDSVVVAEKSFKPQQLHCICEDLYKFPSLMENKELMSI